MAKFLWKKKTGKKTSRFSLVIFEPIKVSYSGNFPFKCFITFFFFADNKKGSLNSFYFRCINGDIYNTATCYIYIYIQACVIEIDVGVYNGGRS